MPLCIGAQSLPKFLTEDYDPNYYDYDVEAGEPKAGCLADSPEELSSYRAIYAQFMESYLSDNDRMAMAKTPRKARLIRLSRKNAADTIRRSLVTNTLQLAAKAPSQMEEMMRHLFEEIEDLTAAKYPGRSSTADSRARGDREEVANGVGDTRADVEKDTGDAEKKPRVDSPGLEGTAVNIEGLSLNELMEKIEQLTSASELKNTIDAKEKSSVGSPVSDQAAVNDEVLPIDELMNEIEELTNKLSVKTSRSDTTQDLEGLQDASSAEAMIREPEPEAHVLNSGNVKRVARMPRAARVCEWVQKKLRRGANHLHKQPEKDKTMARANSTSATISFCDWTELNLRRVACCLYCDNGDDTDKAGIETMVEAVQNGAIDVLKGLRAKLEQLIQALHRKENKSSATLGDSEDKFWQNQEVTTGIKELTKAEERSLCGKITHMLQEKQLHLSKDQQVAIVHGIIQMLKDPDFSDSSLGATDAGAHKKLECRESDVNGGHGDPYIGSGYQEGQECRNGSEADGEAGHEGAEETGRQDDGEESRGLVNRAFIG